jgi:hypothetical protein
VEHKVTLRELQMEERQVPKRTQTVVIDNSQMGVLVSVLAVPRGASMLDEYTQGGAEIEWAYEVVAEQGGKKTFEKLVRDKTASQYQFCSNMRVQNVFGGVSGAMVYPNQQVQAICERGTPRVNVTDLRREVLQRLIAHVAAIPELASVIERSQ